MPEKKEKKSCRDNRNLFLREKDQEKIKVSRETRSDNATRVVAVNVTK
ncbi:MAG: hypothetical protein GF308_20420 [Candidatus Heimdallarchaeota archaeon]|nr:hypothetical protein [Candidatus Heimdallarchaeota archaeon]